MWFFWNPCFKCPLRAHQYIWLYTMPAELTIIPTYIQYKTLCISGLPDPFAKISVDGSGQCHSTEVCKNTLDPKWNQHYDLWVKYIGLLFWLFVGNLVCNTKWNPATGTSLGFDINIEDWLRSSNLGVIFYAPTDLFSSVSSNTVKPLFKSTLN